MVAGNIPELLNLGSSVLRKSHSLPNSPAARTPGRTKRKTFKESFPESFPESIHSGAFHSGAVHSGAVYSGAVHSVTDHSGAVHSGDIHSGALYSGAVHNGATRSGAVHSGAVNTTNKTQSEGWLKSTAEDDLSLWAVTRERGFLPSFDPLTHLPLTRLQVLDNQALTQLQTYETLLSKIPKLVVVAAGRPGALREALTAGVQHADVSMGDDVIRMNDEAQAWRAFMVLSFLAHAYVWADTLPPADRLPASLARPWCQLAKRLGVPPVLSYATYNLLNWRKLDPKDSIELGNIVCLANFNGGLDEEWFRLIHVAIEQQAAPAIAAIFDAHVAIRAGDVSKVSESLDAMRGTLRTLLETLKRMQSACDPHVYYHRVRPYTSGWRNSTDLPNGLIYEGVSESPMKHYGATGAQSAVLPALDAALGVQHPPGWLSDYLKVMREHMPGEHRRALKAIEQGPSIRAFVQSHGDELVAKYDEALRELYAFRNQHKSFAFSYIRKQSKMVDEKGTGGTDYMPYLDKHARTTREHILSN